MAIIRTATGTFTDTNNAANTASSIADTAGQSWILLTGEYIGTDTLATPSGWTLLTDPSNAKQCGAYGLYLDGTDTIPAISWGNQWVWTYLLAYSGLDPNFAAAFSPEGRATTQTTNIPGVASAHTPSVDGSLVILFGQKNKTSASDGTTLSAPGGGGFTKVAQHVLTGSRYAVCVCEVIQTTATQIPAFTTMNGDQADATAQSAQTHMFAIKPAISAPRTRSLLGVGL